MILYKRTLKLPDGQVIEAFVSTDSESTEVIAGRGCQRKIDEVQRIIRLYGGDKESWAKMKGTGIVIREGLARTVELHWYEDEYGMQVEMKMVGYLL